MIRRVLSLLLLGAAVGCGPDQPRLRTYVDRTVSLPPAPAGMPPAGAPSGMPGAGPAAPSLPPLSLAYDAPAGWTAQPGGGFRLVTFRVPSEGAALECIVSQLGPEAAEPGPNITRWIGQLGVPAPEEGALRDFLAGLPPLQTPGGWKGVFIDLKPFARDTSMLAAILALPDRTLFVKLTGPVAALETQRAAFQALCSSLRSAP